MSEKFLILEAFKKMQKFGHHGYNRFEAVCDGLREREVLSDLPLLRMAWRSRGCLKTRTVNCGIRKYRIGGPDSMRFGQKVFRIVS